MCVCVCVCVRACVCACVRVCVSPQYHSLSFAMQFVCIDAYRSSPQLWSCQDFAPILLDLCPKLSPLCLVWVPCADPEGGDRGSGPPPPSIRNLKILPKKCNFGIFWGVAPPPGLRQYFAILVGPPLVKMSGSAHGFEPRSGHVRQTKFCVRWFCFSRGSPVFVPPTDWCVSYELK